MALTNAEKQARWRERNVVKVTDDAASIAATLIAMDDQAKLRKIAAFVNDHLKHPDRSPDERRIALGLMSYGPSGRRLSKTAQLAWLRDNPAYRVEAVSADGRRWGNGVRLGTQDEARLYVEHIVRHQVEGCVTSDIIQCAGDLPVNSIYQDGNGEFVLTFLHGACGSLTWRPMTTTAAA